MLTGKVDERREPVWDTLTQAKQTTLAAGTKFFSQGTDFKKINLTNLGGNGEFPGNERMDVHSIRVDFADTPNADVIGICKNLVGRLVVSGKPQITAPLKYMSAGAQNANNGVADARAIMEFPEGYQIPIESGEKFYFELVGQDYLLTDVTTGLYMQVWLDGLHAVPQN
jgi:hypothetical protein